ncbi:conjugative transfer ATPase [Salmonella enterica]|uniref:conjugative transfer ATPase n=1 Tax=Salmonella enterica TaxID=28901 RepID=UPI000A196E16|nr:conjugative transfer ATPase [Salmonella enterica]EAW1317402.1 conjugative transfer ATPase [Salmonella enterica subsp. diarizonae]ECS6417462.1 conjugative transfer ATPase [Salmonella enterica subsp. diarizonae serovar 50:r:z]EKO1020895.1 conjugative transfer ATPase [Salmonella enterica subsp. enterica]EAN1156009.1 conjugative transfer ATPase [Salmonella enterica]EAQ1165272.1 conjugative transfer ATPase [Salmonella enterica]
MMRSGTLTERTVDNLYQKGASFVDFLPWVEYQPESKTLLLDDGRSVGAVYDITPFGTEGHSPARLEELRDILKDALQDSFTEYDRHPWVVQFYCQDEDDTASWLAALHDYAVPEAKDSDFTRAWLNEMERHLHAVSRPEGYFMDDAVSRTRWRAQQRHTRMVVYRWLPNKSRDPLEDSPEEALNTVCERMVSALAGAGIHACRLECEAIRHWLLRWFNPAPQIADSPQKFWQQMAQQDDTPELYDFAESLLCSEPRSQATQGTWLFDQCPHKVIVLDRLRKPPTVGHMTGESARGDSINALFDLLPEGVIMALTIVVWPQDRLEEHLSRLSDRAIGENVESEYTKKDCQEVRHWLKDGHKLYRSALAFYLSAPDNGELTRRVRSLNSLLLNAGMVPVQENDELAPLSSWLRWLPMCFDPARDKRQLYTRFSFVQHLANLLPLFGRESGTGHPGVSYFNRGGGMLCWDPLNREDRTQNGHLLLLGPTGAGKSATLNAKIAQLMALHRPRLFIVEAGNSFGLMADYAREHGLTVNKISLKPGSGITLPLFADAWKLAESDVPSTEPDDDDPEDADNEQRDLLGEMEITARLMITGGELKEDARLTRSDRALIREAILHAARLTAREKRQTLTQDIRDALFTLAQDAALPESRRNRLWEMGEAMNMFCSGFEGEQFNREGEVWPEADITLVDLAMFAREGYEAQLAIAYISLINHINNLGERDQHLARPIVNITDETHIITVNPLLARFLTKGSKMWRKLGIWLWLATQNLSDFPDDAKKLLNMIEWWELLVMPPEEVEQVSRFKSLTPEQRQLLLSATKAPGKYTEGVVLSPRVEALFRVVSPALWLALGMTEKHEKAERMQIMREFGCSELEAAMRVAKAHAITSDVTT